MPISDKCEICGKPLTPVEYQNKCEQYHLACLKKQMEEQRKPP